MAPPPPPPPPPPPIAVDALSPIIDPKSPSKASSLSSEIKTSRASSRDSNISTTEFRKSAKKSTDPLVQFKFALHLLETALNLDEPDVEGPDQLSLDDLRSSIGSLHDLKTANGKTPGQSVREEGIKWLKKLAYSGGGIGKTPLPEAQYYLAECLTEGLHNLSMDQERAFNLYLQASKQNHPESTYKAGFAYENGIGTKKDAGRAVQFYRKAASLGDPHAMHRLALVLQHGQLGQLKNPREAMTWLKRAAHIAAAADSKYPRPIHDLASCYEQEGGSPAVIPDDRYAFELYGKAAGLNWPASQYRLGLCYEFGHLGCPKHPQLAIAWYSKAAEQGHPESQLALSGWYLTGCDGVLRQNDAEAFIWAEKAAVKGNYHKAHYALGHYYETGVGTMVDMKTAVEWYQKAVQTGNNKRAAKRLKEIRKLVKQGKIPRFDGLNSKKDACSIM